MAGDGTWRNHQVPQLAPGSRIADYVIEEQIGEGGMAVVFRARDAVLGRPAAVKVLPPTMASDANFRMRFLRESRAIAAVDEPHILPVYAAGEANGVLYIATRLVAGGDLGRLVRRSGGRLPEEQAAEFITQIAAALDAAHAIGLVHRDVKPGNVLIDRVPVRPDHAYLSDFGLTKADSSVTGLTATGSFLGTPDYCPPEQSIGGQVSGRSDQYALGCVAFYLLTGTTPFRRPTVMATLYAHVNDPAPSASASIAGLPPAVDAVLARALAKRPEERYGSCAEFAAALQAAVRPSWPQGATPWPRGATPSPLGATPWPQGAPPTVAVGPADSAPGVTTAAPRRRTTVSVGAHAKPGSATMSRRAKVMIAAVAVAVFAAVAAGSIILTSHGKPAAAGPATAIPRLAATLTAPGNAEIGSSPVAMSSNGSSEYVAAPGVSAGQSSIYVWTGTSGTFRFTKTLSLPPGTVAHSIAFTPDHANLVALSVAPATGRWAAYSFALSTAQRSLIVDNAFPGFPAAALSGDGSTLAAVDQAGTVIKTMVPGQKFRATFRLPKPAGGFKPSSLQLDRGGDEVVASGANGIAHVVSTRSGQVDSTYRYASGIAAFPLLSPDGSTALLPTATGEELWSVGSPGSPARKISPRGPHWPDSPGGFLFSADGAEIVGFPQHGTVADVWKEANPPAFMTALSDPASKDESFLLLGDGGRQFVSGPATGGGAAVTKLNVWDIPQG